MGKMLSREYFGAMIARERRQFRRLYRGLIGPYQKEFRHPRRELAKLGGNRSLELGAHNPYARTRWIRAFAGLLTTLVGARPPLFRPSIPLFFVTLIDQRQVIDPHASETARKPQPTISSIRNFYSREMVGLNYFGMIDAAMYVSASRVFQTKWFINYHLHALVWGIDEEKLRQRMENINLRCRPVLSYATAAHFRRVEPRDLLHVFWYIGKTPYKQYQVYYRDRTQRMKQWKRDINYVNSVRLYAEMLGITLRQLTLVGGEGVGVLRGLDALTRPKRPGIS